MCRTGGAHDVLALVQALLGATAIEIGAKAVTKGLLVRSRAAAAIVVLNSATET